MHRGENSYTCLLPGVETWGAKALECQWRVAVRCVLPCGEVCGSLAAVVPGVLPARIFGFSRGHAEKGICSNPNADRTVFVDLQKSLTRAPLGCGHVSRNAMTAACACWPPSPDKPVDSFI